MPEAGFIDWAVVTIIIVGGLFIMYRALKEPIDLLLGLIGKGLGAIRDKIADARDTGGNYYDEIRYG